MTRHTRDIALVATFVALAVAGGLALIGIPNVEIVSMTVFLCGAMLGAGAGTVSGALAAFLFSVLNPYGQAPPPLLAAQILSLAVCGMAGGMLRNRHVAWTTSRLALAGWGFLLTLLYDLLTTISFTLVVDLDWKGFLAALALGGWFYVVHEATNALIFALILPILAQRLSELHIFAPRSTAMFSRAQEESFGKK